MKRIPKRIHRTDYRIYVILIACVLTILQVSAQSPGPVKPSGPKVELSLIVTDNAKKSLSTINKDDIRVIEDEVDQTVLSVEPDERPVDCGLVIDSSGSFRSLIASSLEMIRLIIVNRRPADEIFIERFISTDKIDTIHDFTRDGNALIESLDSIKIEAGRSAVIDGLHVAAELVAKHNRTAEGRRKVVVIITDGEDRNSSHSLNDLIKLLREERVQVFVIGLTIGLDDSAHLIRQNPRDRAEKFLRTVAEESGGRVFFPREKAELIDATIQIIGNLRGQFRLTYQSSNNSDMQGFRKVDVKLVSPKGEKRHAIVPRGYYVGSKEVQPKPKEQKSP